MEGGRRKEVGGEVGGQAGSGKPEAELIGQWEQEFGKGRGDGPQTGHLFRGTPGLAEEPSAHTARIPNHVGVPEHRNLRLGVADATRGGCRSQRILPKVSSDTAETIKREHSTLRKRRSRNFGTTSFWPEIWPTFVGRNAGTMSKRLQGCWADMSTHCVSRGLRNFSELLPPTSLLTPISSLLNPTSYLLPPHLT